MMFAQVKGKKLESYGMTCLYEGFPYYIYEVLEPDFSDDEKKLKRLMADIIGSRLSVEEAYNNAGTFYSKEFINSFRERIVKPIAYNEVRDTLIGKEEYDLLKKNLAELLGSVQYVKNAGLLSEFCIGESVGYGRLAPLILDDRLEEIMINGYDRAVFVFHRRYGHCRTNIDFSDRKELDSLLQKIAKTAGKKIDSESPLLDARLPDGNRANATFSFVTPNGPSLTIRKFTSAPLTIVDLVSKRTMSSEVAAFLWVMVEGLGIEPANIIVTGGSSSGKTTTLNCLASFIRMQERVLSIEDTLEMQLGGRENLIQMEARPGIRGQAPVTMDDLLKNALRMRPDRIILGEVRGQEAETLFVAMDTGHKGCLGTLHSNSAKEMLLRLKSPPMSVQESLLPLLNLIVVQYRIYIKNVGVQRRILSISEVSSMDQKPLIGNLYEWDKETDVVKRTAVPSALVEKLAAKTLRTKKDIESELLVRKKIIDWMITSGINSQESVESIIQQYHYDSDSLLLKVLQYNSK